MAIQQTIPAPVKGWNTVDPLASMQPLYAPQLYNWYPLEGQLEMRGGSFNWSTGLGGPVKAMLPWQPASGSQKMFWATDAHVYDCTVQGAVGSSVQTVTNGDIGSVNFTNTVGGHFLWCCNGVDAPFMYDGTNWTAPSITGVTPSNLCQAWIFKQRLWTVKINSQSVGYFDVGAIQGTWFEFPVGTYLRRGGYIVAGTTWTIDGGDGSDDYLILISSEGEVIVYSGTNPSSASSFQLVGVYYLGKPLSKNCFAKIGGDIACVTSRGVFPMSSAIQTADESTAKSFTNKIQGTWLGLVSGNFPAPGWQVAIHVPKEALVVNVPNPAAGNPTQVIVNLRTGALTSFQNWLASSIGEFNDIFYFGDASGNVVRAWSNDTRADRGADVISFCQQAYSYYGTSALLKHAELMRFQLNYNAGVQVSWALGVDFQSPTRQSVAPRDNSFTPAVWDQSLWDVSYWLPASKQDRAFRSFMHPPGYALSLFLQLQTKFASVLWTGTDYRLTEGTGLG